ncbi:MAG: cysteine protease StiP family protein [Candidatus Competibacteraceae bacterium]|nr:cysteine protease StiP family protein [Candidatus Competibacteraceae bacterium]
MGVNPPFNTPISGSYVPEDCLFLLKPIHPPHIPVAEKERLIQSGQRHYSEMITHESPVSPVYGDLFSHLTKRYKARLAQDVLNLAERIRCSRPEPVTLVSLARAGTPIGALVQRALRRLAVDSRHYSISIIRDRGIDERALAYILHQAQRPAEGVVFIDGWTAKGVITQELKKSIAAWNARHNPQLDDTLHVIADLGGVADVAATHDDYVIPSGILGATVSGLVSRSILNEQILPGDFHGCVVYEHLRSHDRSQWFLETVDALLADCSPQPLPDLCKATRRVRIFDYLAKIQREYGITNVNYIKPGVLEASRVMLRRVPGLLLLRDQDNHDITHLQLLAEEKDVAVHYDADMPFNATALIRVLDNGAGRSQ